MTRLMTVCHHVVAMAQPQGPTTQPTDGGPGSLLKSPMFLLLIIIAIFYFVMIRGKSKEQKKRKELLDQLKKNDRVMTVGGIVGHVVSIKGDEVVVKVDESSNTKMTFIRQAIQKVLDPDAGPEDKTLER